MRPIPATQTAIRTATGSAPESPGHTSTVASESHLSLKHRGRTCSCQENQGVVASYDAPGTFGNERRNQYNNPGFSDVDFSVVKNTRLSERFTLQLRAEMFNIFNYVNLAPVGAPQTGAGGTIGTTIGTFNGAPGIGPGEPFNTQFAGKIIF